VAQVPAIGPQELTATVVAPETAQDSCVVSPGSMAAGLALKLVMVGAASWTGAVAAPRELQPANPPAKIRLKASTGHIHPIARMKTLRSTG
jgi:hypothetical protein